MHSLNFLIKKSYNHIAVIRRGKNSVSNKTVAELTIKHTIKQDYAGEQRQKSAPAKRASVHSDGRFAMKI